MNERDEYDLVEASPAQTLALYVEQLDKLDRAILEARVNQSFEAEAIATECIAQIYSDCGKSKVAEVYLREAHDLYTKAGITTKVDYLEYTQPQLFAPALPERVNYFTDEFIATLSHEFRNPLNGIMGMSEALMEEVYGTMNERQLNAVTTIERSGGYLLALVNHMVDLSQLQAGKLELQLARVEIAELCNFCVSFVKHYAIQKHIQLDTIIPADAGQISVDIARMRQVLVDLLDRAIDTTPVGGKVKLAVSLHPQLDNHTQPTIEFAVIDTSKELPPADREDLPQSTGALHQTQRIGFGLMLVQPIVELHGGTIDFLSEIGRGSRVNITLPDTRSHSVGSAESIDPENTATIGSSQIEERFISTETLVQAEMDESSLSSSSEEIDRSPLILIVEDNELNINTLSSYLNAKGYRPILATDGKTGIELAYKFRPDVILMDIQMPEMDGIEAIWQIRNQLGLVDIPIIALTALAMEGDRDRCLVAGANDYLTKPVKLKQLNETIQKFLTPKIDDDSLADDPWDN